MVVVVAVAMVVVAVGLVTVAMVVVVEVVLAAATAAVVLSCRSSNKIEFEETYLFSEIGVTVFDHFLCLLYYFRHRQTKGISDRRYRLYVGRVC